MLEDIRKGQGDVKLTREEFERRLRERFADPSFESVEPQVRDVIDVAWQAYDEYRKSPRTRKAGAGFADPEFELPIEWLDTRGRIQQAEREHKDSSRRARILLGRHPIRAGDDIQLASAQYFQQMLARPLELFVAFDDRLIDAARGEGLKVR